MVIGNIWQIFRRKISNVCKQSSMEKWCSFDQAFNDLQNIVVRSQARTWWHTQMPARLCKQILDISITSTCRGLARASFFHVSNISHVGALELFPGPTAVYVSRWGENIEASANSSLIPNLNLWVHRDVSCSWQHYQTIFHEHASFNTDYIRMKTPS